MSAWESSACCGSDLWTRWFGMVQIMSRKNFDGKRGARNMSHVPETMMYSYTTVEAVRRNLAMPDVLRRSGRRPALSSAKRPRWVRCAVPERGSLCSLRYVGHGRRPSTAATRHFVLEAASGRIWDVGQVRQPDPGGRCLQCSMVRGIPQGGVDQRLLPQVKSIPEVC